MALFRLDTPKFSIQKRKIDKTEQIMTIDPIEYCNQNLIYLTKEELRQLHQNGPPTDGLVRFLRKLEDFVFGVCLVQNDEQSDKELLLFYAEFTKEFTAIALRIPIEDHRFANDVTGVFSRKVTLVNEDKDFLDVYNTLQNQRKGVLEALEYFTFNPFTTPNGTLLSVGEKIIPVEIINRVDFLREIYSNTIDKPYLDPENKIYLMVDKTTGFIKIGKSKNPKYREGTLQSKQPETHLIATWSAPASIEKELHRKYSKFRKRGEWFKLSLKELDEIKEFMDNLEKL